MTDLLSPTAAGFFNDDLDERAVAKAALDAAEEQLQSLCASHAGTFVSVERRGRAMEQALLELQVAIQSAEVKVAIAQQALEQDDDNNYDANKEASSLAVLSEKHRVRRRTLLQHSALLELLELPSLMDACVRSNLYEEALSVAAFSNTLERRHKDNNKVVTNVIDQIRRRQVDLRRHLLHRLKSNVTMPQCLEVVTALRRLNSIDLERQADVNLERVHGAIEFRLQVEFLESRDAWLDVTTSTTPVMQASAAEHILDAIERYRTRVFEVATQFNAIFRTNANAPQSTASLLSMWTARRVNSFLMLLTVHLSGTEDSAALRDALEASVFFASSMGRLGADFTPQLAPMFESRLHAIVVKLWKEGAQSLYETLKICADAGVSSPLVSHSVPEGSTEGEGNIPLDEPQSPPRLLMMLPPLARFVNAILTGLNELRRCLLPGIFLKLRASLDEIILEVQKELALNERLVMTPGFKGDASELREAARRFKSVFADVVEPYLRGSLEAALGNKNGAHRFHMVLQENTKEPETEPVPESEPEPVLETEVEPVAQPETIQEESNEVSDHSEEAEGSPDGTDGVWDGEDDLDISDDEQ